MSAPESSALAFASVSVRGHGALGVAIGHTCLEIGGLATPGPDPSCHSEVAGTIGGGTVVLAPIVDHLSAGLDAHAGRGIRNRVQRQ